MKHQMYSLAAVAAILFSATTSVAAVDDANDTVADGGGADTYTKLSARVRANLSKLTTLSDGGPNPRVTCTDGLWEAADNVAAEMKRIGLVPLGDIERTSFFNIVPGSIDEYWCPRGMMNVIGMVPGTDPTLNDEFVIFSAHIDGPNNQNPQTQEERGNQDTTNAFDDALAVAFGLGLAEEMMQSPPKRNVVFLFDDVEEGWANVLTPNLGSSDEDLMNRWCFFDGKSYFDSVMFERPGFEGYERPGECPVSVPVGFGSWLREPTVDINKVKLIFNIDPLGIAPGASADDIVLAVINGETSTGVDSAGASISLNDIIDEALPNSLVTYEKVPHAIVVGNLNSADALKSPTTYEPLCTAGNNCRSDGGIPNIWVAAMGFQKYHNGSKINDFKELFSKLSMLGLYQDELLPGTAYFSLDNIASGNFEAEALNALTASLSEFIGNLFAREDLSNLTFNGDNPPDENYTFDAEDLSNLISAMQILSMRADAIAPDVAESYKQFQATVTSQMEQLQGVSPETEMFQDSIKELGQAFVGLNLSLDMFNKNYAEKEAFLDQTVAGSVHAETSDAGCTDRSSNPCTVNVASNSSDPVSPGEGDQGEGPVAGDVEDKEDVTSKASDPTSHATTAHIFLSGLGSAALLVAALATFSLL